LEDKEIWKEAVNGLFEDAMLIFIGSDWRKPQKLSYASQFPGQDSKCISPKQNFIMLFLRNCLVQNV
jgi:hypothetical protein